MGFGLPVDYQAVDEYNMRRLTHYVQQDAGFSERPDVLLIDGGVEHTRVAEEVLQTLGLDIPAYGMVKDDKHRTRALVTAEGAEIAISAVSAIQMVNTECYLAYLVLLPSLTAPFLQE